MRKTPTSTDVPQNQISNSDEEREDTPVDAEDTSVDAGRLPAWNTAEMPQTVPFQAKNLLKLLGPGLVLAGGSIGTGEWVMGPQIAAQYQGALLWVALLSILAQVVLNTEVMRYTLCTGEPVLTGFFRCKPGPKFWFPFYLLLDFGSWWPALAGLAAQMVVVLLKGIGPHDTIDQNTVRLYSYIIFLFCAALPLFGGKIYNTLQVVMGTKVMFLLVYMTICTVFFVSAKTWWNVTSGFFDFTRIPHDASGNTKIDWSSVASLAGFAGVGGLGNIMASNFVREKGWGMGKEVGSIPSLVGGIKVELSHIGTRCSSNATNIERFHTWFKYILVDQYFIWAAASFIGMLLPCLLGAQYLQTESLKDAKQWQWAAALANDFGGVHGNIFRFLTLLCGLIIMVPGQFYSVDNIARRWTDALWSGSKRIQKWKRVEVLYYSFAFLYVLAGIAAYTFFPTMNATDMMKIAGNMANLAIAATIFQTLYVNHRFLPAGMRPSLIKSIVMVIAASFFLVMFGLVVQQKIWPAILALFAAKS
jgi:hypothetical protein